jgi:glutaredoxin
MSLDPYTKKVLENNDKYVIFWSPTCGYSQAAIKLLQDKQLSFKSYDIGSIKGGMDKLIMNLSRTSNLTGYTTKHRTKPIIFYKSKFLGGYTELSNKLN